MNTHSIDRFQTPGRFKILLLSSLWLCGLLFGIHLATFFEKQSFLLLTFDKPSLLTTFFVNIFPVVLIVIILNSSFSFLCYPFVLTEGICHSFSAMLFFFLFDSCAWLFRIFVFFSHSCICVLMWVLMIRHCSTHQCALSKNIIFYSALFIFIIVCQFFVMNPFIDVLVNYL